MNHNQTRQDTIKKAKQLMALKPIYLDTETTGTHRTAEIVEICLIDYNGKTLLDSLIKPKAKIPADATQVHHISNEMVKNAPTWVELWPEIKAILSNRRLAIYNAEFDLRLIKQTHQQAGLTWESLGAKGSCIMKLYAPFYGEWDSRRGSYRWQSLDKAGLQCDLSLPNSHRAKDDTLLARAVLHHMANAK